MSTLLKKGEVGQLAWIVWWVGFAAFVGTIADRKVAEDEQALAAHREAVANLSGRDREVLAKTLAAAKAQHEAYESAAKAAQARLAGLPEARATGWLVALVHDLAGKHGCAVASVDVATRAAEPKESGLAWVGAVARLKGTYPAVRAWLGALAAAAPGRATGGVPVRQLTFGRADSGGALTAEVRFEVLAR